MGRKVRANPAQLRDDIEQQQSKSAVHSDRWNTKRSEQGSEQMPVSSGAVVVPGIFLNGNKL